MSKAEELATELMEAIDNENDTAAKEVGKEIAMYLLQLLERGVEALEQLAAPTGFLLGIREELGRITERMPS